MAVRASMAALIGRVRLMVNDAAGTDQVFSDQEIQDSLDIHRWDYRYLPLQSLPTVAPGGGTTTYLDWYAPYGDWEGEPGLVNGSYSTLVPTSEDLITGRWSFSASQQAVLLTGKTYDLYAAAANILESWAGKVALDFDFSTADSSFHRSQKQAALLKLAREYRGKQQYKSVVQVRDDAY